MRPFQFNKCLFFIILISGQVVLAQRDIGHKFFARNPFLINSANAGYFDDYHINIVNDQASGNLKRDILRYMVSGQFAIKKNNLGIGARAEYYKRGIFETISLSAALAYKLRINKDLLGSFGADIGLLNNNYSVSGLNNQVNFNDPTLNSSYYTGSKFKIGLGAALVSHNLDAGISLPNIFISGESLNAHAITYASYAIELNGRNFMLKPMLFGDYFFANVYSSDFSLQAIINEVIWLQAGYGTGKWTNAGLGFHFNKFELGYNFETNLDRAKSYLGSYHAILLSLYLNGKRNVAFIRPLRFKNYDK